ncbi:MAG: hypothetical protein ACK5CA_09630, partial [Cyanobacteriota bacterium]
HPANFGVDPVEDEGQLHFLMAHIGGEGKNDAAGLGGGGHGSWEQGKGPLLSCHTLSPEALPRTHNQNNV